MIPVTDIDPVMLRGLAVRLKIQCKAFYEDPENRKRFEEWKAARDEEAAERGATS